MEDNFHVLFRDIDIFLRKVKRLLKKLLRDRRVKLHNVKAGKGASVLSFEVVEPVDYCVCVLP